MAFGSKKNKATAEEANAAVNDKKVAKAEKAAEAKAKREAAIAERNAAKKQKQKDKVGSKIEQDKSQLAKDLNIRISSPYGYYPDDVDPIIIDLQTQLSNLSKENKQMAEEIDKLKKNNQDLMTQMTQIKLNAQIFERPISIQESLAGISQIGDITGNTDDYGNDALNEIAAGLLNDPPPVNIEPTKPKLKINLKNNKKGDT